MTTNTNLPIQSGFRLHRLEILNWGTFDSQIWRIEPRGATALLTGENGSGKSTLVDGLLTLLVPFHKRDYNQAAGSGGKRERSELSYVLGAYGRLQRSDDYGGQTQYLRDHNSYSVLLGYFQNQTSKRQVTLAQLFWHQDGLQRLFVVAPKELTIASHFANFEDVAALRKRLRSQGAEVHSNFSQYGQHFRKLFGFRSEKALDLFNQTVMIKEIRRLNDFVRDHMLERTDARDKISGLLENYESLSRAHDAIQKAEQQLALLEPLMNQAKRYRQAEAEIAELEAIATLIPAYFAQHKRQLLNVELSNLSVQLAQIQEQQRTASEKLQTLRKQNIDLNIAINNDEVGQQLQNLERELDYVQKEVKRRQELMHQYNALVRDLQLPAYNDEATFYRARQQAEALQPQIEQRRQAAAETLKNLQIEEHHLQDTQRQDQAELLSLRQRQSQIPPENLQVRSKILQALAIPESAIPFIGELLRVRDKERSWEGASERLLRNFGLRLLVPENHYPRVSRYVNQTNLRGRIVFHLVALDERFTPPRAVDENSLVNKLQIKPDTPYYGWIENELYRQFDYLCCESMEEFDHAQRAITQNGLIKNTGNRHEKDDRSDLHNRRNYILGWSNADKIKAIEQALAEVEQRLQQLRRQIQQTEQSQAAIYTQQQRLQNLLTTFTTFAVIDWRSEDEKLQNLLKQKAQLTRSSDHLTQLKKELQQVQEAIKTQEDQQQRLHQNIGQIGHLQQQHQRELAECNAELAQVDPALLTRYQPRLAQMVIGELTVHSANTRRREVETQLVQTRRTAELRYKAHMGNLQKAMSDYKAAYPAETADFDASPEAIGEFEGEYARIQQDDLPRYRTRFKSLLNEKVINAIAILNGDLHKYVEEIDESIATLNRALRTINYTADTYIQLQSEASRDVEVRDFKRELQACLPDVGRKQREEDYEASFQRIQTLLTKFKNDTRWSEKVTDVRQWLDFAASERYRSDNQIKEYYSDSIGKSGGQKAKLAYTILASAIAYQYGLQAENPHQDSYANAFRFVVIDEAFSRSDQENSRYAMDLFKELDLQLLVVTPMTGIHVVEPYIATCHFVFNNSEGNHSQVENLTIQQLRTRRDHYWQQQLQPHDHANGNQPKGPQEISDLSARQPE